MKKHVLAIALVIVLLPGLVAPALAGQARAAQPSSEPHAHTALFDKTRFVLHMGFAYFAFHHFVYARFHHKVVQADGTVTYENLFAAGTPGRTANLIKAALALLFTVHELKVAYDIANTSSSASLQALVRPINTVLGLADKEYSRLRGCQGSAATDTSMAAPTPLPTPDGTTAASGCQYSDKDIAGLNGAIDSFSKTAAQNGLAISDKNVPVPGAA